MELHQFCPDSANALLSFAVLIVPDREMDSCLDPELPGTSLQRRGRGARPASPQEKESVGTQ